MSGPRFKTHTPSRLSAQVTLALFLSCALLRSEILEHWNTNLVSTYAGMNYLVYADGRYVAFGSYSDYGVIFTSEDGKSWTLRSDGFSSDLSYAIGLTYTGSRFIALGGFGTSASSTNGISWDVFSFPNRGTAMGVAFGAGRYIAVSHGGSASFGSGCIARSQNGTNWLPITTDVINAPFTDITFGADTFVAISSNFVYRSDTGLYWGRSPIPGGSQISFQSGLFIVPYRPGTNLISTDGFDWDAVQTGITNLVGKVSSSHGIFLARAGSYLATSTDGTNWVQYATPLPGNSDFQDYKPDFATDGNRLVTVGLNYTNLNYNGFIYDSGDLLRVRMLGALTINNFSLRIGRSHVRS